MHSACANAGTDMQSSSTPSLIHVALVEDDVHFQNAIVTAIAASPDIRLMSLASTRAQGLQSLQSAPADVLLVDLGLPDGSGIDVIRAAHTLWPTCAVMVCTAFGDEAHVLQSIEAGASGYLLKDSEPENMLHEIRSLHGGGSPISPLIARQILMRFRAAPAAVAPAPHRPRRDACPCRRRKRHAVRPRKGSAGTHHQGFHRRRNRPADAGVAAHGANLCAAHLQQAQRELPG
jgi:DNA-binding NarL/FixJ family response regulator